MEFLKYSKIYIKVTIYAMFKHTIQWLCNSDTFTILCNHHHDLSPEHLIIPNGNSASINSSFSLTPSTWQPPFYSVN